MRVFFWGGDPLPPLYPRLNRAAEIITLTIVETCQARIQGGGEGGLAPLYPRLNRAAEIITLTIVETCQARIQWGGDPPPPNNLRQHNSQVRIQGGQGGLGPPPYKILDPPMPASASVRRRSPLIDSSRKASNLHRGCLNWAETTLL